MTDDEREAAIDRAYMDFEVLATRFRRARPGSKERQRLSAKVQAAHDRLSDLVRERSAARVAAMEKQRGLA